MVKNFFKFLALLFLLSLSIVPAHAGTDYKCLQSCVADGKTAAACLPLCMVNPAPGVMVPHGQTSTDYRCLSLCVNGGKPAATCLPQCTYEKAPAAVAPAVPSDAATNAAIDNTHRVFNAPVPIGSGTIINPPRKEIDAPENPIGTYGCVNQCVQDGMQSQLCSQRCASGNISSTETKK